MVGDFFLTFIILCMGVLIGYPLVKWLAQGLKQRERDRRKAYSPDHSTRTGV